MLHVKVPFSRTGGSYFSAGMTGSPSACRFQHRIPSNDPNKDMRHDTFSGVAGGVSLSICRRAHIIGLISRSRGTEQLALSPRWLALPIRVLSVDFLLGRLGTASASSSPSELSVSDGVVRETAGGASSG